MSGERLDVRHTTKGALSHEDLGRVARALTREMQALVTMSGEPVAVVFVFASGLNRIVSSVHEPDVMATILAESLLSFDDGEQSKERLVQG